MWQPSRWTQNNWKPVICHSWWTNRLIYVTQRSVKFLNKVCIQTLSHMWQPSRWTQNNWKPVICHSWWTNRLIYVTQKCQISEQGLYENLFKLNCEVQLSRHARQSDIFLIERCHSSFAKHMPPVNVKTLYVGNVEARTYRSSSLCSLVWVLFIIVSITESHADVSMYVRCHS